MWNKLLEFGKQLIALARDTQKCKEDIRELREDVKALNQKMDRLSELVQRLAFEFQRDRENAARDREIQRLRLENIILRAERGLPPAGDQDKLSE
jgi:hypothetical protein